MCLVLDDPETIKIRPSDMDFLNHVNNALYFEFLDILVERKFKGQRKIRKVVIQFNKEIPKGTSSVQIGLIETADHFLYSLFSQAGVHSVGELWLSFEFPFNTRWLLFRDNPEWQDPVEKFGF